MKPYIEAGRLYVACPPLYKLEDTHTHQSIYLWNEIELEEEKKKHKSYEIQRYKGLGEMDANQLKETTMGKDRKLIQIKIEDGVLAEKNVNLLMGDKAEPRKE
jgi:topoisomerase-4 subunit B